MNHHQAQIAFLETMLQGVARTPAEYRSLAEKKQIAELREQIERLKGAGTPLAAVR